MHAAPVHPCGLHVPNRPRGVGNPGRFRRALGLLGATLSLTVTGPALACSPARNLDVHFTPGSAHIAAEQLRQLAGFSVQIQRDFPNHDVLAIAGIAAADERQATSLAKARAAVVRRYFERTGYDRAPLVVESRVARADEHTATNDVHRTEIGFLPKPPNACDRGAVGTVDAPVPQRAEQ